MKKNILLTIFVLINIASCCIHEKPTSFKQNFQQIDLRQKIKKINSNNKNKRSILFVMEALKQLNRPYKHGGHSPQTGFDCSGLIVYCAKNSLNISIPRVTKDIIKLGKNINRKKLQPGDLIFFQINSKNQIHVGIYFIDELFIHAPTTGKKVRIDNINNPYWKKHYKTAKRIIY
ncbi:cell wall-associated hydrolase [Candidatus Kinetoplastibacterium desouzaii TCC079E]|uniref:Cell wall-associated hydrolase n=1 Tax=Candidatus Kinetoplastidibacterium desouzai TCC079E TaxID=1208919 RepID=M1L2M1_9PROT|nr:C40 family peptidase [Candidatus Kinetoplastibacterium desouzaii]AGF46998.1 cell wall-associated hydrolase [Candidatus Kinetoplastibacterium desouzaii TCC079E]